MSPKKVAQKRKSQPSLKIPSKITVKIGSIGKPPKIEKSVSAERKIELANEVALAQLQGPTRKSNNTAALPNTQETVQSVQIPWKIFTPEADSGSSEDFQITPEPIKRATPKSKTIPQTKKTQLLNPVVLVRNKQWEVKGKTAKPITKAKNKPKRKKQQKKSVAVTLGDVLGDDQVCMHIAATLPTKQRGRPKKLDQQPGKTLPKSKNFSAKEIQAAASMLEHALGISSQPDSCSNSVVSYRSNLSWTRDISSESSLLSYPGLTYMTGTTSNDIVMFNNILPQIRLEKRTRVNVTSAPSKIPRVNSVTLPPSVLSSDESSSSDSDSSSSSSSSSDSELSLSTSSLTSRVPISELNIGQHISILTKKMKTFYSDILKLDDNVDDDFCSLSEIHECIERELKALFPVQNNSTYLPDTSTNLPDKQLVSKLNFIEVSPTDNLKSLTSHNNEVSFDRSDDNDEDDALSLYAGSISGLESIQLDSVARVSNLHDVYVPKYSPACMQEKYVYRPTKIQINKSDLAEESIEMGEIISNKDDQEPGTKLKLLRVCVSSSDSRDIKTVLEEDSKHLLSHAENSIKMSEAPISSQPRRLCSSYQKINPVRSSLYRGLCFFNIASQCKNSSCRFTHAIVNINTFKFRLQILDEDTLIAEYLLMCVYESLKRKYFLLFVEECNRRKATRILFEIAIDVGLRFVSIDEYIRVEVLETALLHLNTISIDACDDLLKFEHEGTMMCDALLSCMANSQNFAQFKPAFVKLANLMCELNRPVDIQVASSILERVCILPGENFLARGMLALMENTDVSIFENSLACSFELQLTNIDSDVHEVYLLAKKAALEKSLAQTEGIHPATPPLIPRREEARNTSPDSTNVNELPETNKTVFKLTINSESLQNYFKASANPVQKPFVIPKLSQTSRNRHNANRIANQTPGGRWVLGSQTIRKNVTRK